MSGENYKSSLANSDNSHPVMEDFPAQNVGQSTSEGSFENHLPKDEKDGLEPANDLNFQEDNVQLPKKPASAYISVFVFCFLISFGGFVFGWDTGTISGFTNQTDFLKRFGQFNHKTGEWYLSNARTGLIVSLLNVGCAFGGLILTKPADVYGRKVAVTTAGVFYIIGTIISIASIDKWYQYMIGRIIEGLGIGGLSVLSPMLISEVAPKQVRGTLVSTYQLMVTAGIFLGYCTNYGVKTYDNSVQWRVPLGLNFAWALLMIAGMTFVPESPRYLAQVGKVQEAKRSLARSNKVSLEDPGILAELEQIEESIEAERAVGDATIKELFSFKGKILHRVIMGVVIQSLQQLTGDNYYFYYGTTVFKSVGLNDSFETSIVFGVVNFFSTFFGIYYVERFGRRTCLLWGAALMVCCYVVYASVGVTRLWPHGEGNGSSKGAGDCMIVFSCFFIYLFASTWGPIAFVIISESFPLRVRSKGMALAMVANWMWGFLISFFTPFITGAINFYYGYVFMGCLVFAFFYVFFFVPETKGLTLEEVNTMWEEGVLPWKSASWVPPERRGAAYDSEALAHDDKPWYKALFTK